VSARSAGRSDRRQGRRGRKLFTSSKLDVVDVRWLDARGAQLSQNLAAMMAAVHHQMRNDFGDRVMKVEASTVAVIHTPRETRCIRRLDELREAIGVFGGERARFRDGE
jgi:hypothetical protein